MIIDLPYEKTFDNFFRLRILGEYRIESCLAVYLDVEYLKSKGIYEQVWAHEVTHLTLTTSTTFGHALMFLAKLYLEESPFLEHLFDFLMKISWEAQEGAAMLTEWAYAKEKNPNLTESQFLSFHSERYKESFSVFNSISQILLHPDYYWMKPIVANAIGQFFLNTDILLKLPDMLQIPLTFDVKKYFNSVENHPQRRRIVLNSELGEPMSAKRDNQIKKVNYEMGKSIENLKKLFPFLKSEKIDYSRPLSRIQRIQFTDEINQAFLKSLHKITSLPLAAFHSYEAGEQYDELVKFAEKIAGKPLRRLYRFDMSRNLELRSQFDPSIVDPVTGKIIKKWIKPDKK